MKKLKGFLENSAIWLLSVAPIATTFAGGMASVFGVTALAGASMTVGLALASIAAGTYLGFVAGYVGISRAPARLTGLTKAPFKQDLKTAALLPLQGAAEIARLLSQSFNTNAGRKRAAPAPAPAPQPQPASPKP